MRRTAAKKALIEADADKRLRRALLRKYKGTSEQCFLGQRVWFWRDAKQPDLVKIRWLGPAFVVMREVDEDGKPTVYWLAYKIQLIRCAPHHVRGDVFASGVITDPTLRGVIMGGVGWGRDNDVRCCLQTKMMFFG